jgi:hypothetical protein
MIRVAPCLFVIICAGAIWAEKIVGGDVASKDFIASHGPFVVEKDIIIPAGTTVEIPAGCVFLFANFTGIQVYGKLLVKGTSSKPVIFTSKQDPEYNPQSDQLPNPFDWNGIYISKESAGSIFDNFRLSYSVYGIKSQSEHLVIQNGLFQQNGQYHVTIREKIQVVQENIPFNFDAQDTGRESGTATREPRRSESRPVIRLLRWGGLALGAAAAGIGGYYALRASESDEVIANWDNSKSKSKYDATIHQRNAERGAAVGGFVGSALGLTAFGVSFAF